MQSSPRVELARATSLLEQECEAAWQRRLALSRQTSAHVNVTHAPCPFRVEHEAVWQHCLDSSRGSTDISPSSPSPKRTSTTPIEFRDFGRIGSAVAQRRTGSRTRISRSAASIQRLKDPTLHGTHIHTNSSSHQGVKVSPTGQPLLAVNAVRERQETYMCICMYGSVCHVRSINTSRLLTS